MKNYKLFLLGLMLCAYTFVSAEDMKPGFYGSFLIAFVRLTLQKYDKLQNPANIWDILHKNVMNGQYGDHSVRKT